MLAASVVVAGVGVARTASLPKAAGIGFAVSMVLFVLGGIPDNGPWQSIAALIDSWPPGTPASDRELMAVPARLPPPLYQPWVRSRLQAGWSDVVPAWPG